MKKLKWYVVFFIFFGIVLLSCIFIKTRNVMSTNDEGIVFSTFISETSQSSTHHIPVVDTTFIKEGKERAEKEADEPAVSSVIKEDERSEKKETQIVSHRIVTESTRTQTTNTKKERLDPLGNSGKEFATYEEAYEWGYSQMVIRQMGYVVGPVMYSDGSVTYSVDFRK